MEALQAEISGLLTPGNELVVAGAIALYGTAQIAREKHEILRERPGASAFQTGYEDPGCCRRFRIFRCQPLYRHVP